MLLNNSCWKTTLILLGLPFVLGVDFPGAVLYDLYDSQGMNIEIKSYTSDLSALGFDDRARSACILGVWLFYIEHDYNPGGTGGVYQASTTSTTNPYCFDFESTAGRISSVRFSGSANGVTVDTFNLYEYNWFQGVEEYITSNKPNLILAGQHESLIITGMGNWTVFEGANYSGPHLCLIPVTTITKITDITEIGIQLGSLRSVRKGCDANPDAVVHLPAATMFGSSDNFTPISHLENV